MVKKRAEREEKPDRKLTPKQAAFVREYLIDLNATQAAIRAGYSAHTAQEQSSRLLSNAIVSNAVTIAMENRGKRTGVTAEKVLVEIERLAMYDPKDLTEVRSPADIAALPEEVRRAIVGWGWDKSGNFTIKMVKQQALEMLGRHHKLFTDKVEVKVSGLTALLERINGNALKVVKDDSTE